MRYMIIVKASRDTEAGVMPEEDMFQRMAIYHEELSRAGVLVDAAGLHPTSKGWRVEHRDGKRSIVDGPFAETKEIIAGFTMIRVNSEAEAREWSRRFPNPAVDGGNCHIEVRRLYEVEELGASESLKRFSELPAMRRNAM
jgi:hypothetical protein